MGALTDVTKAWAEENLEEPDLTIHKEGDCATLKYSASSKNEEFSYTACIEVSESTSVVQYFLYASVTAPAARRAAMAEAVARINYGLLLGHIDLEMEDGGLRYYTAIDVEGGTLSTAMINNLHGAGESALEKALPILMAVAYGNASASEAIEQAQKGEVEIPEPIMAEAPPWERIAGADFLKSWVAELKAACVAKDAKEWRLTGQALVMVTEDPVYCQSVLLRVAADAGFRFVTITADDVMTMPSPVALRRLAPVLIYLEPGRWCLSRQEDESEELSNEVRGFQSKLVNWLGAFDPNRPVLLATSQTVLGRMSELIDGSGRFDRYLALPSQNMEARGETFLDDLGRDCCGQSLIDAPGKLGKLISDCPNTLEWRELVLLYLHRLHRRSGRPIEFLDMMHLATHGFAELAEVDTTDNTEERRQIAVHEAGHAAVAILDSGGLNIPDYCSIVPGADFKGVVAESVAYNYSLGDRLTYRGLRHKIRISLAGRVAEEIVFGPELVSNGASGDLENCYQTASNAFYNYGFAPGMGEPGASASNLAIVVGNSSPSESAHNEELVRRFLATEYAETMELLQANRSLLNTITDRLMWDPIVDQEELKTLCSELNLATMAQVSEKAAS